MMTFADFARASVQGQFSQSIPLLGRWEVFHQASERARCRFYMESQARQKGQRITIPSRHQNVPHLRVLRLLQAIDR